MAEEQVHNNGAAPKKTFRVLPETSVDEDGTEYGTHQRIADTIYNQIEVSDTNLTIGLEGGWGSGKSSIVKMLFNKIEKNSKEKIIPFYFDTWAHGGDPLRRIFLESMIETIMASPYCSKNEIGELTKKKEEIAARKQRVESTTVPKVTLLGILFAMALLLVPLGSVMIEAFKSNCLYVRVGFAFILLPLMVLFFNAVFILFKGEKLFNGKYWIFVQGGMIQDITQTVSLESERTSVEFERYFYEIMKIAFKGNEKKLLIVVDNLDRVDPIDAKKMWSTLQTFLQSRNPLSNGCPNFLNKLTVLVPYDPKGMSKVWSNEDGDSYLEKCFQLRITVPKMIVSGWEIFCRRYLAETGWSDAEDIIAVLKATRESVMDNPSPREIKAYINQIGILRAQFAEIPEISVKAIAYYCYLKYLKKIEIDKIEKALVGADCNLLKALFERNRLSAEGSEIVKQMAGILYGIAPEIGMQLLLSPEIINGLDGQPEKLRELEQDHPAAFWIIMKEDAIRVRINTKPVDSGYAIEQSIWKSDRKKCIECGIDELIRKSNPNLLFRFPQNKEELERTSATMRIILCDQEKASADYGASFPDLQESIWSQLGNSLETFIKKENDNWTLQHVNNAMQNLFFIINKNGTKKFMPKQKIIDDLDITVWDRWINVSEGSVIPRWVIFNPDLLSHIKIFYNGGNFIDVQFEHFIDIMDDSSVLSAVSEGSNAYLIEFNKPVLQKDKNKRIALVKIIYALARKTRPNANYIIPLMNPLYPLFSYSDVRSMIAFCYCIAFDGDLNTNKGDLYEPVRNYWRTDDDDCFREINEMIDQHELYPYIHKMVNDRNVDKALLVRIISDRVERGDIKIFNASTPLESLHIYLQFMKSDALKQKLCKMLIKEEWMIYAIEGVAINFARAGVTNAIIELLNIADDNELFMFSELPNKMSNENWQEAIMNSASAYNRFIAIYYKRETRFKLPENCIIAMRNIIEKWYLNTIRLRDSSTLSTYMKMTYKNDLESLQNFCKEKLIESRLRGNEDAYNWIILNLKQSIFFGNREQFIDIAIHAVAERNQNILKRINALLAVDKQSGKKLRLTKNYKKILSEIMEQFVSGNNNAELKSVVREIAEVFDIELTKDTVDSGPSS